MAFDGFRENGFPTYYGENKTPWEADVLTSGLIFAFVCLAFSLYIILPGFKGLEKLFLFIRITISLFIGGVILVTLFTQTWETAETHTRTKYKAGIGHDVNVKVGVLIGLKGVNITLKGDGEQIKGEKIDYNEHFSWNSPQGRLGFGPYAGEFNRQYRAAQFRGLPLPILWVAEYFTLDGEGIRWGRIYRQAGFYAHIMLWLSLPLWLLSNILFFVLLRFGAYMLMLTGLCMLTCNIIWGCYRNFTELKIPFTAEDVLEFSFGGSFWVVLFTGILCVVIGALVFVLDKRFPIEIAKFFGVDVLQDGESLLEADEDDEEEVEKEAQASQGGDDGEKEESSDDDDDLYSFPQPLKPPPSRSSVGTAADRAKSYNIRVRGAPSFRSSENRLTSRLQKPRRRDPPPRPPSGSMPSYPAIGGSRMGVPAVVEEKEEEEEQQATNGSAARKYAPRAGAGADQDFPQQRKSLAELGLENGADNSIELKNFQHN